jgi:LuxR family maltose regulon positive regulatory protein
MIEILKTKLFIPRPRSNLVARPRLTNRLSAGLDGKLTLIAAPAGYGKTTLLSEWIPQSPRCITWLSADQDDNDPTIFWSYLIASFQQIHPEIGASAQSLLQSAEAPLLTSIITSIINDIVVFNEPFATVIDDYHFIGNPHIHESVTYLIEHLPENIHLIITTRIDPYIPLSKLRAQNRLTELRANDLKFTSNEASSFLTRVMGLTLTEAEVTSLELRTEGWIAGLQIAALSMQNHEDVSKFILELSGNHRHIMAYLADEVLNQRPKGTLEFLLQTSILDHLSGPLCDAITEGSGGQELLENLEHANLFITPLDGEGRWYRYHHLFAEILQARLQKVFRDRLPDLHRRAVKWLSDHGMIEEAVHHAIAGGDLEEATRLIQLEAGRLLRKGSSTTIGRWLDAIPEESVRAIPELSLARGWTYFFGPRLNLKSAEEWAQRALQVAKTSGTLDTGLKGEVAALQAMIAVTRSDIAQSLELSRKALDELPIESPWRTAVTFSLGTAYYLSGNIISAAPIFEEAVRLSQPAGEHFIQLASASFLGEIRLFQGRISQALDIFKQVLTWADSNIPQKGGVMAHGGIAYILCEQNQLDAALTHIELGARQIQDVGGAWSAFVIYRALARIHQARGNLVSALDVLELAQQIGERTQVSLVIAQAAALKVRIWLAQGDLAAAYTWAECSGLNPDDSQASHPGWHEIEYLTLARVLNMQGKYTEALTLLDHLLRAAQTDERNGSTIAILITQALVLESQGSKIRAFGQLERALTLAEPEGYIRVFIDEGEPIYCLLKEFRIHHREKIRNFAGSASSRLIKYVDVLLSAFSQTQTSERAHSDYWSGQISSRELQVLHLIELGLTNQEIAERLVIAVSTVKSHINSIYNKIGADNRVQALTIAREQGLLSLS